MTESVPSRSTMLVEKEESSLPVKARCKNSQCGATVGEFQNAWLQISNSYFLPSQSSAYRITGLKPSGKTKPAQGSALEGW